MYSKRLTGGKRGKTYFPPYQVALPRESAGKHATHLTMGKRGKAGNRLYQRSVTALSMGKRGKTCNSQVKWIRDRCTIIFKVIGKRSLSNSAN